MNIIELKVIRLRNSIIKAFSVYLMENPKADNENELLTCIYKTSDVIEHIAEYAIDEVSSDNRLGYLITDLDGLSYILNKYTDIIKASRRYLPVQSEIDTLKNEILNTLRTHSDMATLRLPELPDLS
jgi:hypothetical protein